LTHTATGTSLTTVANTFTYSVPRSYEAHARYNIKGETSVSKSSNTRRTIGLLFVFAVCVGLVCADLVVSSAHSQPQNSNSSTTQEDDTTRGAQMTSENANTATPTNTSRRRRRRGRRRAANTNMSGDMNMNANTSGDMSAGQDTNANMSGGMTSGTVMTASESSGTQTDLSGTYTGNVNYPEGGLSGPATLTITGNNFQMTPDGGGSPVSGRVTAVTTRGYTGVTMMFGDLTPPAVTQAPPPLPAVSLRARMSGGRVTLNSVPGEKREFSFSSGGGRVGRTGGGKGGRRSMRKTHTMEAPPPPAATP
jgi:hypothetical protein